MVLYSNKQQRSSFHIFINNKSDLILWIFNFSTWFKNIITICSWQPPFFVIMQGARPRLQPTQLSTEYTTGIMYVAKQIQYICSSKLVELTYLQCKVKYGLIQAIMIINLKNLINHISDILYQHTSTTSNIFSCVQKYINDAQSSDDISTTLINKFYPALTKVSHTGIYQMLASFYGLMQINFTCV